jgi:hypothetical protein
LKNVCDDGAKQSMQVEVFNKQITKRYLERRQWIVIGNMPPGGWEAPGGARYATGASPASDNLPNGSHHK